MERDPLPPLSDAAPGKARGYSCYHCPVINILEVTLAIVSGMLGMTASVYALQNKSRHAAVIGGLGLLICNIVWLLRLL